jgi:hypothetical protein
VLGTTVGKLVVNRYSFNHAGHICCLYRCDVSDLFRPTLVHFAELRRSFLQSIEHVVGTAPDRSSLSRSPIVLRC